MLTPQALASLHFQGCQASFNSSKNGNGTHLTTTQKKIEQVLPKKKPNMMFYYVSLFKEFETHD